MLEREPIHPLTFDLLRHPAVRNWSRLEPKRTAPRQIERLKRKEAGAVYRLLGAGPGGSSVIAKRCRPEKGRVERTIFAEVLPRTGVSRLELYGSVNDDDGSCWLFLEDAGTERYSPASEQHRMLAMRWLARFHTAAERIPLARRLPRLDADHYLSTLRSIRCRIPQVRAIRSLAAPQSAVLGDIDRQCQFLESGWDGIEALAGRLPRTLVHGDCLAKNVHVRATPQGPDVAFFDWGGAGWGLPGTDLGQLDVPHHVGSTTRRDLAIYAAIARERWPDLDLTTIESLASLGQTFWSLKVISRELEAFESRWATVEETIGNLRVYATVLAESTRPTRRDGPAR